MSISCGYPCKIDVKIAPGSEKWIWFEWSKREIGTATISAVDWDLPDGMTEGATSTSGLRVGILLSNGASEGSVGWLAATITTSSGETLQARRGVESSYEGH